MAEREQGDQVAVYIDFDNVVISRYDEVHGERSFHNEVRNGGVGAAAVDERLISGNVEVAGVHAQVASFGTVAS